MKGYCNECKKIRNANQDSRTREFCCNICGSEVTPLFAMKHKPRKNYLDTAEERRQEEIRKKEEEKKKKK